ncbi:MAG TPA: thiamine phosphate synthase [Bacteroidia bacterium]|jgi:thiamine-phosphate pyrophosphorylase|nr:thiamine phosphate synthase [Bacteroidia bacterium]
MKVIVITPTKTIDNEQYLLGKMIDMGLPTVHVRKPNSTREEMIKYLEEFPLEHRKHLVLHSHHKLLWDYSLKGIHLAKSHRKQKFKSWLTETIIKIKRDHLTVSTSSKSLSSMSLNYEHFDYVMLAPVFTSPHGHRPSFSPGIIQQVMRKFPDKIIARGGASAYHIEKAQELGFSGIAFHNCIWTSNNDPIKEYSVIKDRFNELKIAIE